MTSISEDGASKAPGPLRVTNFLIVGAFAVNALTTFGAQRVDLIGGITNGDVAKKYNLLTQPAGFAFAIWGPIFAWEAFFSLVQLLPRYRNNKVVDLVAPGFVIACLTQSTWNFLFAQELMVVALIFIVGILAGLMLAIVMTDGVHMSWEDYICLRGMFSLHGGWIVAATSLNVGIVADQAKSTPEVMLAVAVTSVGAICIVAAIFALAKRSPDPIVPSVAAWAFWNISMKLGDPTDLNNPLKHNPIVWAKETIGGLQIATAWLVYIMAGLAAVAVIRSIRQMCSGGERGQQLKEGLV